MEPLAGGAFTAVAGVVTIAVLAGALIGAAVWRLRAALPLAGVCVVLYLLVTPPLARFASLPFAVISAPPLIMIFLVYYLTARHLGIRRRLRAGLATVAALVGALTAGFLYMLLYKRFLLEGRLAPPAWIAVGADAVLALFAIRSRNWSDGEPGR